LTTQITVNQENTIFGPETKTSKTFCFFGIWFSRGLPHLVITVTYQIPNSIALAGTGAQYQKRKVFVKGIFSMSPGG